MQISTVSMGEMVQLYSSFVYTTTDALNCNKTLKKSNKEKAITVHNCDFKYPRKVFELDDIIWNSCLCRFRHPTFNELMILSKNYEKGIMADNGGLLDQPSILIERLEILEHLKALHKENQQKEMERKNGRSQHRPPAESRKRTTRSTPSSRFNKPN